MAKEAISGYEIVEILGEGPRSTVYKARDLKSRSWVAVKFFHTFQTGNRENLLRLKHPNVAAVYDFGRTDSQSFAVMEYLSGGRLKDHIRSMRDVGDVFPLDQVLTYTRQVADALMYAHDLGLAHGNVKTDNVMFGEDGTARLTDFFAGMNMSFEAGRSADLEGYGKLLYETATGQLPFPGVAVAPVESFRKDLPAAFVEIVRRLLDRERQDCYKDFRSIVSDLHSLSFPATLPRVHGSESEDYRPVALPPALAEGRLLAGRFRIVRFIARGGMGDVYEAEDLELRERVALKTLRTEIAGTVQAMERFRREIQLARKVTHPNVCRIYDLFHDTLGSEPITFLIMELLKGETLQQRLLRTGRMTEAEALPVIRQMAAGLAAAHKAGVIHRDFKSSNVILVTDDTDPREFRTVITDFGLARSALPQEATATLSNAGDVLGTPAYMAPEQLENGEITPAADIYAFGIVLYEMMTGTLPFPSESGFAWVLKRLREPAPSPRTHVPELNAVWETTILRCLDRNAAARFGNIDDVIKSLSGEITIAPASEARRKPSAAITSRRHLVATGVVLLLVVALLAGALRLRNKAAPAGFKSRPAIAVLSFKNLTGQADAAWLSTALAEMLTTELAAGEKLRAIPGESVARMSVELSLPDSSSFSSDTLARIRNYLGADVLVHGSYVVLNSNPAKVRMDLRLQDSAQGDLLATISEEGDAGDLLTLVSRSGAALREKLGVGKLEAKDAEVVHAALPATPRASRFYADGLEKLRVFDALAAQAALEKAVLEDGRFALARAALATAWSMLGYASKAREESRIAVDLSTGLGREDQLVVEGRAREAALEWRRVVEVYRTLSGFFPDNIEYGVRLAEAQVSAGDAREALATIERLRGSPAPDRDNPRIDLAEARAAGALSDFRRQQDMAARAAAKGKNRGAKLLVAGARRIEGRALASVGELTRARTAFEEAREMYIAAGDRWDATNAATDLADIMMQSGDLKRAEDIYEQSLTTYRELGNRKGEAAALTSIGVVFRNRGDFLRARTEHEKALGILSEIGDRTGEARSRNDLANVLSLLGDVTAAREMYQTALPVFREIGDRNSVATVLNNLGELVSEEGDLARAHELYEEARATFQDLGNQSSLAHELSRLGDLDLINGDLASARKKHEQALALRTQLGEKASAAESRLALAQIALHEGDGGSAEASAKLAAEAFAAANRPDDEASAMAVLARSRLRQEKYAESAQAIQRAEELSMASADRGVRLSVAITGASIRAARGDAAKAMKDLEGIVQEAHNANLVQFELEARLALAEVEIAAGRVQVGRRLLDALEKEASKRGYKFIADRAAATRKKIPGLTA
jgi:serine/threonine protein kinase/tetratricopeptide (TPR) repeat protein